MNIKLFHYSWISYCFIQIKRSYEQIEREEFIAINFYGRSFVQFWRILSNWGAFLGEFLNSFASKRPKVSFFENQIRKFWKTCNFIDKTYWRLCVFVFELCLQNCSYLSFLSLTLLLRSSVLVRTLRQQQLRQQGPRQRRPRQRRRQRRPRLATRTTTTAISTTRTST